MALPLELALCAPASSQWHGGPLADPMFLQPRHQRRVFRIRAVVSATTRSEAQHLPFNRARAHRQCALDEEGFFGTQPAPRVAHEACDARSRAPVWRCSVPADTGDRRRDVTILSSLVRCSQTTCLPQTAIEEQRRVGLAADRDRTLGLPTLSVVRAREVGVQMLAGHNPSVRHARIRNIREEVPGFHGESRRWAILAVSLESGILMKSKAWQRVKIRVIRGTAIAVIPFRKRRAALSRCDIAVEMVAGGVGSHDVDHFWQNFGRRQQLRKWRELKIVGLAEGRSSDSRWEAMAAVATVGGRGAFRNFVRSHLQQRLLALLKQWLRENIFDNDVTLPVELLALRVCQAVGCIPTPSQIHVNRQVFENKSHWNSH